MVGDVFDFFGVLGNGDRLDVDLLQLVDVLHVDLAGDAPHLVHVVEHTHQSLAILVSTVQSKQENQSETRL